MQDHDNLKKVNREIMKYGAGIPSERKLAGAKRRQAWWK